jgi:hypothetical protein
MMTIAVGVATDQIRISCVNLDLTALPVDVDALHRLVRELAAQVADDDTALAAARAEVDRLQLIIQRACARATSASTSSNPRAS